MASAPRRPSSRTSRTLSCLSPLLLGLALAAASPVRFDQRQNGSVNVQVDLKDLEVFAIVEDEQLEGAVAQAVESVRPSSDVQESLKGPLPDAIALPAAPAAPPVAVGGSAGANGAMQSTGNAPRRPNDKLAAIKHKTGGLLPHERSDAAPLELPPWDAAAARGEEVADDSQEEEDLEPRSTTAVEARAAPAPPAPVPAGSSPVAPPPPGTRPTQSQGVRPAGTVSVAHLHCGLGYYRDQTGRCRRARRPSSSNTRKHHHGTRRHRPAPVQGGAKPAAAAPAATPVSEPEKDLPSKESSVKQAAPVTKDTATKTSAPKQDAIVSDSKESVKEATPISGTPAKDPVGESASPVPVASPLAVAAKPAVKEAAKEPVKEALKEVVKEPVSAHKAQPVKQAPAKQAAAVKVPVQDRIASSGHKASSTVSGNVNVKEAVKLQPVQLKAPPKPPLREAPGVKPQRQQPNKPVAAAVKDKEAPKVSHHHGQHKITVIKEDTKPRSPPAPVKVAVKAASPTAVAAPATPVKKN